MFLGTDTSVKWRTRIFVLFVILVASYVWYARTSDFTHGGSTVGLWYGYIAGGLILLLTFFSVRKRAYRSRLGSLEGWAQAHSYLGLLVVVVVLFHSGFRFEDRVGVSAFIVMCLVSLSGLFGAVLYTMVPRILTEVGAEPGPAELDQQLNQLRKQMGRVAHAGSPQLQAVYGHLAKETKPMWMAGWRVMTRAMKREPRDERLRALLREVDPVEQPELKRLLVQSRQHHELHKRLASQQRYRNLLQVWLWAHVPLTVALIVLVVAHVIAVYYYT